MTFNENLIKTKDFQNKKNRKQQLSMKNNSKTITSIKKSIKNNNSQSKMTKIMIFNENLIKNNKFVLKMQEIMDDFGAPSARSEFHQNLSTFLI